MRVAFMHTVGFLVDRFRGLMQEQHPAADSFHILNEGLLQDLLRGRPTAEVYRRVVEQIVLAADGGAGLVVVTCSSTSPAVDIARALLPIPVLKIDDPMAAEAIRLGRSIAVVCTNTSTPGPSEALLQAHAAAAGRPIEVEVVVRPGAYQALLAGDRAGHDAAVTDACRDAAKRNDVIVLAQASLSHLQQSLKEELGKPILSSPGLLMQELGRRLQSEAAQV